MFAEAQQNSKAISERPCASKLLTAPEFLPQILEAGVLLEGVPEAR